MPCFTLIERKEEEEEEEGGSNQVGRLLSLSLSPSLCAVTSSLLISSHFSPPLIRLNSFSAGLGRKIGGLESSEPITYVVPGHSFTFKVGLHTLHTLFLVCSPGPAGRGRKTPID